MTFDASRISTFSGAQFASANSIAKLDTGGDITSGGTYRGALSSIFRSSAAKESNNAVRTELLKSLGQAFNLSGMTEADGKVSFSKDFMDRLESLLGKDVFKREDFKIGDDGTVTSGRPLTSRRISTIVAKAEEVGARYLVRCGGGEYDAAAYEEDFKTVQHAISRRKDVREGALLGLNGTGKGSVTYKPEPRLTEYFNHVGKCLRFLNNDFEGLISENEEWVSNARSGKSNEGVARYVITDPKTQGRIPMHSAGDLTKYLSLTNPIGLFEPSLYPNIPKDGIKTPEDLNALKDYIRSTLKVYVQSSIDLYFDASAAGKLNDFVAEIRNATLACMDNRTEFTIATRTKLELLTDVVPEAAKHTEQTPLKDCIDEEIGLALKKRPEADNWGKIADLVKGALVGQKRPIMTLSQSGDIVPLMEGGKQVVRAVTAEDIDKIGQTCAVKLYIF